MVVEDDDDDNDNEDNDDDDDNGKSTGKVEKKGKNSGTTWKLKMIIVYIGAALFSEFR